MEIYSLYSMIRKVVSKTPDKIAIEFGKKEITYRQLEERSNKIAGFLAGRIGEAKNIPIFMDRCPELVEAVLGVLKAGGLFIPLDIKIPENRLYEMLEIVEPQWTVTKNEWLDKLNNTANAKEMKLNVLVIDTEEIDYRNYPNLNIEFFDHSLSGDFTYPDEIINKHCYIYFTTGSTGKPKAVLGRHRSLSHFIQWEIGEFGIDETSRVSQLIAPSFGPYKRDIFAPLCAGGTLCIPENQEMILNSRKLVNWIEDNKISLIHIVPSLFKVISAELEDSDKDCFENLKYILFCGEALRGNDIRKFIGMYGRKVQLAVLYGQTESTLAKMYYYIKESDVFRAVIPVGRPMTGVEVMLLDENLKKCLHGSSGEICFRTPFISSGYYGDTELTQKVFIKNPFNDNPKDIIYRTGDIARELPDGNIEIIGRRDHQVKIRGMKVQIKGIENKLLDYPYITDVVVVDKDDLNGNKYLCAYYTGDRMAEPSKIRGFLLEDLPDYMVPSFFVRMDKLPLTINGKIDRKQLPDPEIQKIAHTDYEKPITDTEKKLEAIWKGILETEQIGINDNFFEIGGHSLKATALVSKIHKVINKEITLRDVFENRTIKELGRLLDSTDEKKFKRIDKVKAVLNVDGLYPTSAAQKRLFILNRIDNESINYNISQVFLLTGEISKDKFYDTIGKIIKRHETLRTSFVMKDGMLMQKVHDFIDIPALYTDLAGDSAGTEDIKRIFTGFIQPFRLNTAPLFRVQLVKIAQNKHVLMFDIHHIVSDATSLGIICRDFISLYNDQELEPLKIQYKDFTVWQNEYLQSDSIKENEKFWLTHLSGSLPVLDLPTDFMRPAIQNFEGDYVGMRLEKDLRECLLSFLNERGMTLYMVVLAAFNVLLWKYTKQEDIIIGSPIAGRIHADLENLVGMFVNTLPMRNLIDGEMTIDFFLNNIMNNTMNAYENQNYQFDMLVERLNIDRELSMNPLFNVMLTLNNMDSVNMEAKGLHIETIEFRNNVSKFDLTLSVKENTDGIVLELEYCTSIFSRITAEGMLIHLNEILKCIVMNPAEKLSDINMLSLSEKNRISFEFNSTSKSLNDWSDIHKVFERQVEKNPEGIALVFCDVLLTYEQLNRKANKIAWYLRNLGYKENDIIGVATERSVEMVAAILGILKAGAAYVPIDMKYPEERIAAMIENASIAALLIQKKHSACLADNYTNAIAIEEICGQPDLKETNIDISYNEERLIYVLFTSGSTGSPKGAMVKMSSFINLMDWYINEFQFTEKDNILLAASMSFDLAQKNLYASLMTGGTLYLLTPDFNNYNTMLNVIEKAKITMLNCAPSMAYPLAEVCKGTSFKPLESLKYLILGGEPINQKLLHDWAMSENFNCTIVNSYGPTECTDITTFYCIPHEMLKGTGNIPIGKPIQNVKVYILDENNNILPVGVPGEICISGVSVGSGYINDKALTKEKFVMFSDETKEVVYKTGDIGKWLNDGNIEFLGRMDNQVKIRGLRIEIFEIEKHLQKYPLINNALVNCFEHSTGGKYLAAYFTSDKQVDVDLVRSFLMKKIPQYMMPDYFIQLNHFPLTPSGKVDRKLLPEPKLEEIDQDMMKLPQNDIEVCLSDIWREVLKIDSISTNMNYFEQGGNSLTLIRMFTMIDNKFPGKVKITDLYLYPTIEKLSKYIQSGEKVSEKVVECVSILLPDDYFVKELTYSEDYILEFKLDQEVVRKLKLISETENYEISVILLSVYILLLSELSGQKDIGLQVITEQGLIGINRFSLAGIEDYSSLFRHVHDELRKEKGSCYQYYDIKFNARNKAYNAVVPLFKYSNSMLNIPFDKNVFDFGLEAVIRTTEIVFRCSYDGMRLKKTKADEMVNGYIELIEAFLNQFTDDGTSNRSDQNE